MATARVSHLAGTAALALAAAVVTTAAAATPVPTAWQLLDDGEPDKLRSATLTYDRLRQVPVRIGSGGHDGPDHTWELVGDDWVRRFIPEPTPWNAAGACAAFDSDRNVVVLFGGSPDSDETWEYDGSAWTPISPATVPSERFKCGMVYDEANGKIVMFGGYSGGFTGLDETWEYDGTDWTLVSTPASPPPRGQPGMVYDAGSQVVLIFGGRHESLPRGDMWEYDGRRQRWRQKTPSPAPAARAGPGMAYDPVRDRTVVFGGLGQFAMLGDTWEWDGRDWTQMTTTNAPSPRIDMKLVYDDARGKMLGHGGGPGDGDYNDTWEYDGADWVEVALSGLPTVRGRFAMAYDPRLDAVVMYGGQTDSPELGLSDTWRFAGGTWELQEGVGEPTAQIDWQLAYDETGSRLVGFSGRSESGPSPADVHEYQGASPNWVSIPTCCPDRRDLLGWTYAPDLGGVLMFGGRRNAFNFLNDTWVLDDLTWTEHNPPSRPEGRDQMGLTYIPTLGKALLYGGTTNGSYSGVRADTWFYDGQNWESLLDPSPPGARLGLDLIYDSARDVVVLYGDGPALEGVTWEFDGSQWTARTTPFQPDSDRCWSQMAYDSVREVVILFGGRKCSTNIYFNDTWVYGPDPDGDGIVGGLDNCRDTPNQDQANGDGDVAGDACDCAALDPGSFAPPVEVANLTADGKTSTTISWDDQAPLVGSGVVYDLVTGTLQDLRSTGDFSAAQCLAAGLTGPNYTDTRTPSVSDGFHYVARSRNACGDGTYGANRAGLDAASPCP